MGLIKRLMLLVVVLGFFLTSPLLSSDANNIAAREVDSENKTGNGKTSALRFGEIAEEKEVLLSSLPNGLAVLPDKDLRAGNIFSFLWRKLRASPYLAKGQKPESEEAFFETIQRERIGDLMFDNAEDGVIAISSTEVQLLGEGTLAELLKKPLSPQLQTVRRVPARPGSRYLIKTVQGKFGLFRILEVARRAIMIQWIYQPDGSTDFSGSGNLLDRKLFYHGPKIPVLYTGSSTPRICSIVRKLRELGLRVCFEAVKDDYDMSIELLSGDGTSREGTVKSVLDEFVKKTGRHSWKLIEGTNIICIYQSQNSFLDWIPDKNKLKTPIKNRSWLSVLKDMALAEHNIRFPHWAGISIIDIDMPWAPTPPDRTVSVNVSPKDSAKVVLAKICWGYGDGMYFTLSSVREGTKGLVFERDYRLELALLDRKPPTYGLPPHFQKKRISPKPVVEKEAKPHREPEQVIEKPTAFLWTRPAFLIAMAVGIALVCLILLLKKKSSSRRKSRAT